VIRVAAVGVVALDRGDRCGNAIGPGRRRRSGPLVDHGTARGDVVIIGVATGVGVGVLQAIVLARHRIPGAFWWAVANPLGWARGWLVTSYVITTNVEERFPNFGASGALVFGLLTWLLLAVLLRTAAPEGRATPSARSTVR
jgi:hypothetical protein